MENAPSSVATPVAERVAWLDALRGLAIALMVLSNMYHLLLHTPALGWRWIGSVAAPLFITLSGMTLWYNVVLCARSQRSLLRRFFVILGVAVVVDTLVWGIVPFMTMDVLYLIAASLPLTLLFARCGVGVNIMLALTLLACAEIARGMLGYAEYPVEVTMVSAFTEGFGQYDISLKQVVSAWLVSGWFPFLPWSVFAVLGLVYGKLLLSPAMLQMVRKEGFGFPAMKILLVVGVFLCMAGIFVESQFPMPKNIRAGYVEVFYPPSWQFVVIMAGVILMTVVLAMQLYCVLESKKHDANATSQLTQRSVYYVRLLLWHPLCLLGRYPLTCYTAHLMIIAYFLERCCVEVTAGMFVLSYFGVILAMIALLRVASLRNAFKIR